MFKFITHRPLWLNILAGLFLAIALFAVFLFSLKWITHHNRYLVVPDITGKSYEEARKELRKMGFEVIVQDSVYIDTLAPLTVLKQFPESDAMVKVKRSVYLTISRVVPPEVEMPNLIGYSFRNAELVLKNMNLRIGDTSFRPDFARNAILEQSFPPGTKLPMGSVIDLVLGDGIGGQAIDVPDLTGRTLNEARIIIDSNFLILGPVIPSGDITDTANAYIWKQNPRRQDDFKKIQRIRPGQMIDVWIQQEKPVKDSLNLYLP